MNTCTFVCILMITFMLTTAQIIDPTNFDDAQVYWPSQFKRSSSDSEMFAFPGIRGLRGKRDPYNKRVPMMSLKGLRGKRARFVEQE